MPDDPKLWVALTTGGLALLGSVYATVMNYRSGIKQGRFNADHATALERLKDQLQKQREEQLAQAESEKVIAKFREPLAHAAYDLQSRIYNILDDKQEFLQTFYTEGNSREKEYAVENTVFLFAQFLGWTEAIRQEIQFLDLGREKQTRELRNLQDGIYHLLGTDKLGAEFRMFAGEQRAVGELMIERGTGAVRCIGFAAFCTDRKPAIDYWLDPLREDIRRMATESQPLALRLIKIQNALIELLKFLDPKFDHFPESSGNQSRTRTERKARPRSLLSESSEIRWRWRRYRQTTIGSSGNPAAGGRSRKSGPWGARWARESRIP
jgi:hypothetical protein